MSRHPRAVVAILALGLLGAAALTVPSAQTPARRGTENGEWRTLGGDIGHTRYSPLDQITPANFETLKEAWKFSPIDVVGPMTARATPSYVGGKLLSVAGPRRHVVSIDPTSGKLLWSWVGDKLTVYACDLNSRSWSVKWNIRNMKSCRSS